MNGVVASEKAPRLLTFCTGGAIGLPSTKQETMSVPPETEARFWSWLASASVGVASQPSLRISDVTVTEGNSGTVLAVFNVTLTPASASTVTVAYATANGSATAGRAIASARLGRFHGLLDGEGRNAARYRHTEVAQDVLALVLVNLHEASLEEQVWGWWPAGDGWQAGDHEALYALIGVGWKTATSVWVSVKSSQAISSTLQSRLYEGNSCSIRLATRESSACAWSSLTAAECG